MVFGCHKGSASRAKWQEKSLFSCISEAQPILSEDRSPQGKLLLFCHIAHFFIDNLKKMTTFAMSKNFKM